MRARFMAVASFLWWNEQTPFLRFGTILLYEEINLRSVCISL